MRFSTSYVLILVTGSEGICDRAPPQRHHSEGKIIPQVDVPTPCSLWWLWRLRRTEEGQGVHLAGPLQLNRPHAQPKKAESICWKNPASIATAGCGTEVLTLGSPLIGRFRFEPLCWFWFTQVEVRDPGHVTGLRLPRALEAGILLVTNTSLDTSPAGCGPLTAFGGKRWSSYTP